MSFLEQKELFIFDLDGTVYLGDQPFSYAVEFINQLRDSGKKVLFYTNNSSKGSNTNLARMQLMGFNPLPQEMMSSGDVLAEYLLCHCPGKRVFLLGTPDLHADFSARGITLVPKGQPADIVVSAMDTTLTYDAVTNACRLIFGGAQYLCTHNDLNCPTDLGFVPDSGAIAAMITATTGVTPEFFGKPFAYALELLDRRFGIAKEKMCIFGDRLYTDIAFGKNNGITAILVLTGEATAQNAARYPKAQQPDFIFPSLREVASAMALNQTKI